MAITSSTKPLFSFAVGNKNINGRYIQASYIKESGTDLWIFCGVLFFFMWVFFLAILVNWPEFTYEKLWPSASTTGGLFGRIAGMFAIPTAIFSFFFFPPFIALILLMLWPEGKGWMARDCSFAKWYGKWREKQKGWHHEVGFYYFGTSIRYSMAVDVFEDRFIVNLPSGELDAPYSQIYKSFEYQDLCVFRVLGDNKAHDIIIDLREVECGKRKEFKEFMNAKKEHFMKASKVVEPWVRKKDR